MDNDRLPYSIDSDEDAQLAHAIALSLQDSKGGNKEAIVISSSEDDDCDDLDQPLAKNSKPLPTRTPASNHLNNPASGGAAHTSPGMGILGLDRKKMEEERLSRLRKRRTPDSEVESQGHQQRLKPNLEPAASTKLTSSSEALPVLSRPTVKSPSQVLPSSESDGPPAELPYPKGVVRRTWVKGYPRREDDITIEDVLQKDQLKLAVLSSFQWDEDWMTSKIDISRTKLLLVAYAPDEVTKKAMVRNVPSNCIRFCFPPMHGLGKMHSKLQLLKYSKYMRIVVPTGNLVPYDWGETGTQENAVFLIDIPKRSASGNATEREAPQFAQGLFYFLRAQGLDEKLVSTLEEGYDFSETSRYGFVHSIAGPHNTDDSWRQTGYCGLGRTVKSLGLDTKRPVEIDFTTASLGMIKPELLHALYYAAQGDSGLKEYEKRTSSKRKADKFFAPNSTVSAQDDQVVNLKERFRIYFPSRETVVQSRGGIRAAGTICLQRKWWAAPTFPRELVRDCKNAGREGVLLHSKMIFVRGSSSSSSNGTDQARPGPASSVPSTSSPDTASGSSGDDPRGGCDASASPSAMHSTAWAYVGSANLSESAWGRLTRDQRSKKFKMFCRNWECGVVVPVHVGKSNTSSSLSAQGSDAKPSQASGMGVFQNVIPVPFQVPAEPLDAFSTGDAATRRDPWFFTEAS